VNSQSLAIVCTACGADTFIRREPRYDGFEKVGEKISCVSCGHEYASEDEAPFKATSTPRVFTKADRSKQVKVFKSDEKGKNCRYCRHYIVNPFVQRCGLNNVEVQATDICEKFDPAPDENDTEDDPLAKLLEKGK